MDAKRQFNMGKQKYAGHVMEHEQSQAREQQPVMHAGVQECKLLDKVQSSCKLCAVFAKERGG